MKKVTIEQIVDAIGGKLVNVKSADDIAVDGVVIDSRKASQGDMYVAIVGERVDGHDYISAAIENGAVIALSENEEKVPDGCPAIIVENSIGALGLFAKYYRQLFDIPFIGVTGSVGKTSTKDMIAGILGTKYKVHKTDGNFNNDIGLPLTLLALEPEHEMAVIEMGMNHFGEIDYLADILKPDVGVITNIGISHIEFLGSREGILKAKTEMLPHVSNEGRIILNGDDDMLAKVLGDYGDRVRTFGRSVGSDCRIVNHEHFSQGQHMVVATEKNNYDFKVAYPGEHLLFNALAGILIGEYYDLAPEEIVEGIADYQPSKMRLQQIEVADKIRILDDAYNASVESMDSALKTLMAIRKPGERAVAVLGSMFEMGDYASKGHTQVGASVANYNPDVLLVAGKEAKDIYAGALLNGFESGNAHYFESKDDLLDRIDGYVGAGDLVLLKASRGMAFEKIRDYLIRKYED